MDTLPWMIVQPEKLAILPEWIKSGDLIPAHSKNRDSSIQIWPQVTVKFFNNTTIIKSTDKCNAADMLPYGHMNGSK